MRKTTRNVLICTSVAAASAAVCGAVSYSMTKNLMSMALDRKEPKNISKGKELISGVKGFSEITSELQTFASELENAGCEEVEITSRDGIKLVGHWYECDNAERVIIAMHGWRSSWSSDFGAISSFWHKNKCSVLYAEQRGQNNSGGDYMSFGLLERYDCLEWIYWAIDRTFNCLPIYLGGISMGATTVLMTAGLDLPDKVHGIVADCAFTSPKAIWKHVVESNLHLPYKLCSYVADDLCRKKLQIGSEEYSTLDAMKSCHVPIMFIHGTEDTFVPVEMTYENYKACVSPKRLFIVPGANHAMSYFMNKKEYETAVKAFWNDYDN